MSIVLDGRVGQQVEVQHIVGAARQGPGQEEEVILVVALVVGPLFPLVGAHHGELAVVRVGVVDAQAGVAGGRGVGAGVFVAIVLVGEQPFGRRGQGGRRADVERDDRIGHPHGHQDDVGIGVVDGGKGDDHPALQQA